MNRFERYLIDEKEIEAGTSLALYQTVLAWAADKGDRFVISLNRAVYDEPEVVEKLRSLGQTTTSIDAPSGMVDKILANLLGRTVQIERIDGIPGVAFVDELTSTSPPAGVSGDLSPVEDVVISLGERRLYACYDYGRTQVLELSDDEVEDLRKSLARVGLDPARLIPAPHYPDSKT